MAQEFEIINANSLPAATNITDNDMILIIQGSGPKRALPSAMKGKPGDPGLSVYLGVTSANIQWKQGATGVWQNLIELEKIRGPKGEKPLFRKQNGTLQMKYEGQPDTAYVSLFDREELKMKFSDLTAAEVDKLKLHFSDLTNADKAELMKPATDAATEVRQEMVQISTKAGQVIEATNTAKGNAETATTAANQAASAATTAAGLANTAVEETETATGLALSAATLAEEKAGLANTAAQGATTAKENAEAATTEATEAALAADTAAGFATTATTDATAAKDAAVLAARNAQEAADNVQDGKTPQLGIGTVESGSEASATVAASGSDESGNPKYTLSFVLPQGEEGKAPVIEVGTITTGEPGTGASAELVSNGQTTEGNPKYLFNLSVPRGNQGLPGSGSGNVLVSENGLVAGKKYLFVPSEDSRSEGSFIEYIAPDIPSKTTDLTNDSGFITKTVSDLTNYYPKNQTYTKSDTYTKSETDSAINTKLAGVYKVQGSVANYAALPTTNVAIGDVYNVLDTGANYVATATTPTWDKLSETIDLSAYSTTAQADAKYFKIDVVNRTSSSIKVFNATTPSLYTSLDSANLYIKPTTTGTNATGVSWYNVAGTDIIAGIGVLTGSGEFTRAYIGWGNAPWIDANNLSVAPGGMYFKGAKVWNDSNDGPGSGLDADTLDGIGSEGFLNKQLYNPTGGTFIVTTAKSTDNYMLHGRITGNAYTHSNLPIDTTFQFYNYNVGNTILAGGAKNNGYTIPKLSFFNWNGRVCILIPYISGNQTFSVFISGAINGSTNSFGINLVDTVTNQGIPSSGVTRLVEVIPENSANLTSNVASATKLQTVRTLWGNTFDGTGNVSGTVTVSSNGLSSTFGQQNSTYCHLSTNAPSGFHFSKFLNVAGDIIPYTPSGNFYLGNSASRWSGIYLNGNVTTYGNSGWKNATWDGGMEMVDSTFVRASNNKSLQSTNSAYHSISTGGGFYSAVKRAHSWGSGYGSLNVLSDGGNGQTPLIVLAGDGEGIVGSTSNTRYFSMEVLNNGSVVQFKKNNLNASGISFDLSTGYVSANAFTGNSASANKLSTARTINGVAFDGTSNITVTAAANGGTSAACSGNAATATKLQTARTIQGVAFDGTGNITLPNATASANGLMSAVDKNILNNLISYYAPSSLSNLNPDYSTQRAIITSNQSLSASSSGPTYNGRTFTVYVYSSNAITITIPTTGNYVSMCGSSYTCPAGKWVEFNFTGVDGTWHIAKLEQE